MSVVPQTNLAYDGPWFEIEDEDEGSICSQDTRRPGESIVEEKKKKNAGTL